MHRDARRSTPSTPDATHVKHGLAFQPVKFGISFTVSVLNQAGALVVVYTDGSAQINHGGTEMGQGLHTKMAAVAADALGLPSDRIRVMHTNTEKVPNTTPTAASSGSDLNGAAVLDACRKITQRMRPVAAELLGCAEAEVCFEAGRVHGGGAELSIRRGRKRMLGAARLALSDWIWATPGVAYDRNKGEGTPFYYYAYGGAVSEVELCGLTGEHRVRRGHPARRGQPAGPEHRPRAGRGSVYPRHGLAHRRGGLVSRGRSLSDRRSFDVQDPVVWRHAP